MTGITAAMAGISQSGGAPPAVFSFDPAKKSADITLSVSNTVAQKTGGGTAYVTALALPAMTVSDTFTVTIGTAGGAGSAPGVGLGNISTAPGYLGMTTDSIAVYNTGDIYQNALVIGNTGFSIGSGDVIRMQITSTQIRWSKNGGAYSSLINHNVVGTAYAGITLFQVLDFVTGSY